MSAESTPDEIERLRAQFREATETLDAIRNGEVDAIVVGGQHGQQVYTLQNADRPYRVLIEQMQEGAITLSEDGQILYCNDRFANLTGLPRYTIISAPLTQFLRPLDGSLELQMPAVGAASTREMDLVADRGRRIPVNVSLSDMTLEEEATRLICGVVTDLTLTRARADELRAANTLLAEQINERRQTEDNLQLTLEASGMGVWGLDLRDNQVRCSARHYEIFGHHRSFGTSDVRMFMDQFIAQDKQDVLRAFNVAKTTGALEFEARINRAGDGVIRWLHVKGRIYFEGSEPVRIAGVVSDVTERHEVEEQLRQSQKMEAVGQLTGGIAHDFNNLLAGITGSLQLLEKRLKEKRYLDLERYVTGAQTSARRAAALTQRLLAFSRRQTLDPKLTDINRLISGMEELIRRSVGPNIVVEVVGAGGLWATRIDPSQLESALLNLCINARDAMPNGGKITIETANKWLDDREAKIRELTPGQYVSLCVSDTGTGMTPDVIAQAFDPFFTTKPLGQGTGLGLSMIHGFVRQSGGQVRIYSELGEGTTMCLYFPRVTGAVDLSDGPELTTVVDTARGETILVVDDEALLRTLMTEVLQEAGYSVLAAFDGTSGLKILQSDVRIDLLVTDVGLPGGMNGRQLADAARETRQRLKVLFVTGYAENAATGRGLLADGMHVVSKPFDLAVFTNKVRELIEE